MSRKNAIKKVDAGEAKFMDWFVAQFGERPTDLSVDELDLHVSRSSNAHEFSRAAQAKHDSMDWDMRRDAALKAWCARDKQKG